MPIKELKMKRNTSSTNQSHKPMNKCQIKIFGQTDTGDETDRYENGIYCYRSSNDVSNGTEDEKRKLKPKSKVVNQ